MIREHGVDEVVFAYSDVSHEDVMHRASIAIAAGADFTLMGTRSTMIASTKPVVAVCAVRTGCGKSQTSREVGRVLLDAGLKVALVRHPMPYHDLESIAVQRFATLDDIDASNPTIEEREEYERPVEMGMVMYAGVDYGAILEQAQDEADVVIWDGGNNDFSFYRPDLTIVVVDPLRAGHASRYHPGEANLRMADVVVINKVDSATPDQIHDGARGRRRAGAEGDRHSRRLAGGARRRSLAGRQARPRHRRRADDHPRRDALRSRHGRGPQGERASRSTRGRTPSARSPRRSRASRTSRRSFRRWATPMRSCTTCEATINAVDCDAVIAGTPMRPQAAASTLATRSARSPTPSRSSARRGWRTSSRRSSR